MSVVNIPLERKVSVDAICQGTSDNNEHLHCLLPIHLYATVGMAQDQEVHIHEQ